MVNTPEPQAKPRAQIWILVAVFFAPLLVAFLLYYGAWRPAGSTNHGDLIDPPRTLSSQHLTAPNGAALAPDVFRGKWSLVYIGAGDCDARCREALTLIRQTRLALGDEMPRVQRVFLATAPCCDEAFLAAEHAGLITAEAQSSEGRQLLAQFPDASAGKVYIVDPLGNLMMSYAPDAPPKGLLEDMKKLLKLSHIG